MTVSHLRGRLVRTCAVVAAFFLVALVSPQTANSQAALIKLHLATIPSDFAGQLYYAKDQGFFQKAGFDVDITPLNAGPAIAAAVAGGTIDLGFSNVVSLALAHDKGLPFVIVAPANMYVVDAPTIGLIGVMRGGAINSAKDLNGKTLGVGVIHNITDLGARAWIDATGGDSKTIKYIEVPIPEMAVAVKSGRVDAAVMDQGVYPTLGKPGDPLRILANSFSVVAPTFVAGGWFTTSDWIKNHPVETKKFAEVMRQTAVWANTHHDESAVILGKYLNEPPEQIRAINRVTYGTALNAQLVQPSIELCAKYGVIKASFPAREMLWDGAAK
jgi:NitT/TauT family transport system substrate-binding protein